MRLFKNFAYVCFTVCILSFACNSSSEPNTANIIENRNTVNTPQQFLEWVKKERTEVEKNTSGFEIEGEIFFINSDSSLVIYNFIETFDEWQLNCKYSICMGYEELVENISENEKYSALYNNIREQGLNTTFFKGNFSHACDFLLDHSNDFLLTNEKFKGMETFTNEQIILYDGKNTLYPTQIKSQSNFHTENETTIPYVKEELKFIEKEGSPPTIFLSHNSRSIYTETFLDDKYNEVKINLSYQLTWRWSKENMVWETGLICTIPGNEKFEVYSSKYTQLNESEEGYFVQENCQNGGVNFFQLKKYKTDLSDYYMITDNEDDVAYYAVLKLVNINDNNQLLLVARGGESALESNRSGYPEIGFPLLKWFIHREIDEDNRDIFKITGINALYTDNPEKYKYNACK
ncbi:MAG: hypothetical protein HUU48_10300 [Flavobacteriales bacterium]|nr:hypothetical protein [Flavobacteriales bacterium]